MYSSAIKKAIDFSESQLLAIETPILGLKTGKVGNTVVELDPNKILETFLRKFFFVFFFSPIKSFPLL